MDLTQIPKELIYMDRRNLDDFSISRNDSVNNKLYSLIKNEICIYERNNCDQLLLQLFNNAYYLTTMILMDHNLDNHIINLYISKVFIGKKYSEDFIEIYKKIVCAMVCIYLEEPSLLSNKIDSARILVQHKAQPYAVKFRDAHAYSSPKSYEFAPIKITAKILENIKWSGYTYNYKFDNIQYIIEHLGKTFEEKRILIESIAYGFDNDRGHKYAFDSFNYLSKKYREYGGDITKLHNYHTKEKSNIKDLKNHIETNSPNWENKTDNFNIDKIKKILLTNKTSQERLSTLDLIEKEYKSKGCSALMHIKNDAGKLVYSVTDGNSFLQLRELIKSDRFGKDEIIKDIERINLNFPFIIKNDLAEKIVDKLQSLIKGKKSPKDKMMPIRAAQDAGAIRRPHYSEIKKAFGDDFISNSSYHNYTDPEKMPFTKNNSFILMVNEFKKLIE